LQKLKTSNFKIERGYIKVSNRKGFIVYIKKKITYCSIKKSNQGVKNSFEAVCSPLLVVLSLRPMQNLTSTLQLWPSALSVKKLLD